jgi:hypothetical protein
MGEDRRREKKKKGPVAEWLGRGLQNLVQRFKSARDLNKERQFDFVELAFFFSFCFCVPKTGVIAALFCAKMFQ